MKRNQFSISSFELHTIAMAFMLCDHMWATVISGNEWLTCIGRIAFPIFAFLIVEGYFHTHNLKKYVLRLLVFALISEIPFNLMVGSSIIYPLHQNVIWTFLMAIFLIFLNEKAKDTGKLWKQAITIIGTLLLSFALGLLTFTDYGFGGILTVLAFYFFRGTSLWCRLGQLAGMYFINISLLGGYGYEINIGTSSFFIEQQGFALLSLIPIWLYKGEQGIHNKITKYFFYFFYPVHMLILAMIQLIR